MNILYKHMLTRVLKIAVCLMAVTQLHAQESQTINITTTAVPFLRISPDARSGGMGDAGMAISPDANSGFYNLAKIPFAKSRSAVGATYTPWLKEIADGMYLATLSGFHRLDDLQAVSASLRYFSAGDLLLIDYSGNKLQTTQPREFAFDIGYARRLSGQFGLAIAMRYIHSSLAKGNINGASYKAGNAIAGDLSVYYNGRGEKDLGWSAGLSLTNLGSKISYTQDDAQKDFLPATAGVGIAYKEGFDEENRITFALEANKLLVPETPAKPEDMPAYRNKGIVAGWLDSFGNEAWQLAFGAEYEYHEQLYLRLGYNSKSYAYGNWQYATAGAGIRFNIATINFSYFIPTGNKTNKNPLGNTVRFGVMFGWD